jgi:hypothetical protein
MIGDDPYTLGLFDTAGQLDPSNLASTKRPVPDMSNFTPFRSGGLRPTPAALVPANGRLPRVFQRDLASLV